MGKNTGLLKNAFLAAQKTTAKSACVLKLYLTEDQKRWVEQLACERGETMSGFIVKLIEAQKSGHQTDQKLDQILKMFSSFESTFEARERENAPQIEILLAYVKEIFRESSANLYRLNAMVDEFAEPETVRSEVNEFVRKQESMMRLKAIKAHEAKL